MMSTGEARSQQPFQGQQRQQRHPEDGPINGFLPSSSAGVFLLPGEAQGGFTFSAEPGMIDYSSMVSLPASAGNAQESVFTPNTGSSLDSSLHPDFINQSYPPANAYMHPSQNYSLSPGTNSRTGQSISPSHSVDHLSPEAGYISDPNYQELSSYTTPNFNTQYLEEPFSNLNFGDNNVSQYAFNPYSNNIGMALPITPDVLATHNAQLPPTLPSNAPSHNQSQLISPCPTSESSPVVFEDGSKSAQTAASYNTASYQPSSSPPNTVPQTMYETPSKQQHSPALTNSPARSALANPQARTAHLTSPIVRVENYSRGESPSPSDNSRPMSKRSHGSRISGNHLSPYPVDNSSDEEDEQPQVRVQHVTRSAERNEDGSWQPGATTGQAGLTPEDRDAMQGAYIPSIEEIAEQRLKDEKKLDVQDWLTKSEMGSEAGDPPPPSNHLKVSYQPRRRAKSTNDAHRQHFGSDFDLGLRTDFERFDDSGIPGPGRYIDERSEYDDYDDDEDDEPQSPPAEIDVTTSHDDDSYFPQTIAHGSHLGAAVRPWIDTPNNQVVASTKDTRFQPPTSNAAMMRFRLRAKDVETASLTATLGSRRLSESDLGSIRAAPGVIKVIEPDPKKQKERQRRPSFLDNLLPKRAPTNLLKRKGSIPVQQQPAETGAEKSKELVNIEKPKRMGSWGRPKSPRLDTSVGSLGKEVGVPSPANLSATSGPWYQGAKNAIKRSRSRSDLGKSPGLAELMTQHGGPPMPMLASPLAETEATKPSPQPSNGLDDDDEDAQEAVTMDLKVRLDPIIPTPDGFKTHARQLNPRLVDYMVERITQEQIRRYKRLLEFKVKHLNAVKNKNCSSKEFCTALGGDSKQLPPRAGNKDSDAPFIGFQITAPGSSDDDGEPPPEGTVVSAQFPSGVPLPPVKRLPAEFECPLCFKVKKFYKPSDWTKHVHEDVQPFTCTFPNCGEPKSFKRKADWVRHENERHRQLENWTCQIADCNHTCYRKDNFVQHLVREHKIAEPRVRTARGQNKDTQGGSESEDIWSLVERCRRDTTKQPKDEPCRFCGNICNSWKKLTVHLAKHMEQISMPILPLIEQRQMTADTIISPVVELPESRKFSSTPSKSPVDNPSRYNPNANSTLAPGIDPSFGQFPPHDTSPNGVSPNGMHTYPPPQMVAYKAQQTAVQKNGAAGFGTYGLDTTHTQPFSGSTYPGLQIPTHHSPQPYLNGNIQNGPSRYPITPVSAIAAQSQQSLFTSSPVDTTSFSTGNDGSAMDSTQYHHFSQEPQGMGVGVNGWGANPAVGGGGLPFDATPYQQMAYMNSQQQQQQQHGYQFQG